MFHGGRVAPLYYFIMRENDFEMLTRSNINTPQFPGIPNSAGTTSKMIETIRKFIKQQKRARGYFYNLVDGANNGLNVELSGTAKFMLGLALNKASIQAGQLTITLKVNNEVIFQDLDGTFLSEEYTDDEYYYFPRPLSGQDSIILDIQSSGAQDVAFAWYYI